MDIPRRSEIPELIQQIQSKQRGEKATALLKVMEEYRIADNAHKNKETWFKIVSNVSCKYCGGVILERVGPFPVATPGGNHIMGCPNCNTFKAELGRQDILYKPPEQKQISDKE